MTDPPPRTTPLTPPRQRGGRGGGGARTPRGGRGAQSRGRGRGRGGGGGASVPLRNHDNTANETGNNLGRAEFGGRLTEGTIPVQTQERGKKPAGETEEEEGEEKELCFICASEIDHYAVAPCNHRTCHVCALRMRALFKTKTCLHCRTNSDYVIFTNEAEKRYEEFQDSELSTTDTALGIKYESPEIHEDTIFLLRYNCPDRDCTVACLGWPDLHRHVRSVHHKVMCDLCTRNKKAFTHEHELFTPQDLKKHERFGDDHPGAVDQTGFKGHPECGFCRQRFYGDDELYTHCRDRHEKCHVCDRRDQGRRPQYFVDYNSLELHFRKDHFLCPDRECLEKKFVVFDTEMDLKAHQIEAHPNGLTKDAMRDARRVDLGAFTDLRERYQPGPDRRRGRDEREGRGRGRGRDPNSEPLPSSSAQPMRRDELAYQRQMAIQSSSSVNSRSFGGQLTTPSPAEAYAARPPEQAPTAMRGPTRPDNSFPSLGSLRTAVEPPTPSRSPAPAPEAELSPQEQARRLRHQAVVDRASNMLRNDQPKLAEFRTKISHYKTGQSSAAELIDSFFAIFDRPAAEIGSLVKELADIFEIQSKRDDLLKAWNDWKAINEDYPSLPGSSTASTNAVGGKRVLKLKKSTAQSAHSAVGRAGGWGNTQSTILFPTLPAARMTGGRANGAPKTAWAGATPQAAPIASARPAQQASVQNTRPPVSGGEAFPALPAAAKPRSSAFTPSGKNVIRTSSAQPSTNNPWGPPSVGPTADLADDIGDNISRKKGNKNKKQTLIHWG